MTSLPIGADPTADRNRRSPGSSATSSSSRGLSGDARSRRPGLAVNLVGIQRCCREEGDRPAIGRPERGRRSLGAANGCALTASSGRSHNRGWPSSPEATNTRRWPSGEIANDKGSSGCKGFYTSLVCWSAVPAQASAPSAISVESGGRRGRRQGSACCRRTWRHARPPASA